MKKQARLSPEALLTQSEQVISVSTCFVSKSQTCLEKFPLTAATREETTVHFILKNPASAPNACVQHLAGTTASLRKLRSLWAQMCSLLGL